MTSNELKKKFSYLRAAVSPPTGQDSATRLLIDILEEIALDLKRIATKK